MSVKAYHVTDIANLTSIMTHGLIPQIGPRSSRLEHAEGVYLFKTLEAYEDAMMNWLGDELSDLDDGEVVVLEVDATGLKLEEGGYELVSKKVISPTRIERVLTEDLDVYLELQREPENKEANTSEPDNSIVKNHGDTMSIISHCYSSVFSDYWSNDL